MSKPRFSLMLEAAPRADDADGTRRLRMALKALLRRHGLRCLTVVTVVDAKNGGESTMNQAATAAVPEQIDADPHTVT